MNKRSTLAVAILVIGSVAIVGRAVQAAKGADDKDKTPRANKAVQRVTIENGQAVLSLAAQDQARLGIKVAPLQELIDREQVAATAVVLPIQDLAALRENYVTAQTNLDKAVVEVNVTSKERERLKKLYQDNQNISEKTLEAQEGAVQTAQADAHAARQQMELQQAIAQQGWGPVLAKWLVQNSSHLQRVLNQRDLLLQATPPQGSLQQPPKIAAVPIQNRRFVQARLLSSFPRLDPRIQGMSFLYLVPSSPGLVPGLNLSIALPARSQRRGVLIPDAAVIWFQGKAWVYQQTAPDRFTRREVLTNSFVKTGYFVSGGFAPGDRVVTGAAQLLLSEELRPAVQPGAGEDKD